MFPRHSLLYQSVTNQVSLIDEHLGQCQLYDVLLSGIDVVILPKHAASNHST